MPLVSWKQQKKILKGLKSCRRYTTLIKTSLVGGFLRLLKIEMYYFYHLEQAEEILHIFCNYTPDATFIKG